jgi:hypothetical protein
MLAGFNQLHSSNEFRKVFVATTGLYMVLLLIEYAIGSPSIGVLGQVLSAVIIIYFGITIYKTRSMLHSHAIRNYFVFIIILLSLDLLGWSLLGKLIHQASVVFIVKSLLAIIFWVCFLTFWEQEHNLPKKSIAFAAATSIYLISFNVLAVAYLLLI